LGFSFQEVPLEIHASNGPARAVEPPYLRLLHLSRAFGEKVAVDEVSLDLRKGELFVLLGPSGCGKTTTLRLLAGLETPTRGEIFLNGRHLNGVPPRDRGVAMVFQEHTLYPHMRVEENLGFGLKMQGLDGREIRASVAEIARMLGIEDKLKLWPHQLSGGEAQRVALGKALIRKPQLLLLDEPLSDLDPPLRRRLREEIRRIQRSSATTTIHVTHDQEEAMALGDRMGILNQGRLLQVGTPKEIYENPNCVFAAQFLGSPAINLIPGEVLTGANRLRWPLGLEAPLPRLSTDDGGDFSGEVWVGVRPEDVLVSRRSKSPPEAIGTVEFVHDMGFEHHVFVSAGGVSLRARCSNLPEGIEENVQVYLKLKSEKMLFFRTDTGERILGRQDA